MSDAANDANPGDADLESLLADAEGSIDRLDERFGDLDDLADGIDGLEDEFDDEEIAAILDDLENVVEVVDELEDLIHEIDLSELPEAIDPGALLEAIDVGEVPAALTDEDTDVGDVVTYRTLLKAINLTELWDATNVRDLWREKRELAEETDELTDDASDDDGIVSEAADAVTGDDGDEGEDGMVSKAADAMTGDDDEGWFDGDDEWIESDFGDADVGAKSGMGFGGDDSHGLADGDAQEYQVLIQQKAFDGIGEFREALLKTHAKFQKLYEANREKMRRQDTSTNSRNPTAASTLVTTRRDVGGTAGKHSTVPQQVKYSTAPSRKRIYGKRFEQELEKRREELREKRDRHREQRGENE